MKLVAHQHLVLRLSVYSYTFNSLYVFKVSCWIKHIKLVYFTMLDRKISGENKCGSCQGRLDESKVFHLEECDISNVVNKWVPMFQRNLLPASSVNLKRK